MGPEKGFCAYNGGNCTSNELILKEQTGLQAALNASFSMLENIKINK